MRQKVLSLFSSDQSIFFLANIVFSASTYMVMLLVPYMLTIEFMAEFASVYNVLILLLSIFELGIPFSFLRFYQMYKITFLINTVLQITVLTSLMITTFTPIGTHILTYFHLDESHLNTPLIFIALIGELSWSFARSILLSERKFTLILTLSCSIFIIRAISIGYLYFSETLSINTILISIFTLPYISVFYIVLSNSVKILSQTNFIANYRRTKKIFFFYLKRFMKFSFLTFIIGTLYVFSGRYLIIYLTEKHQISMLADLGYAMTFLGIITIAAASFRTFFVSKFHLGDKKAILLHLSNYMRQIKIFIFLTIILSAILAIIVYFIMPNYLSINAPIFVFIMTTTYGIIFLMSMITFLARTMNYNVLEFTVNLTRLIIVILIARYAFLDHPLLGFLLINLVLLLGEIVFAKIILKRLRYV